MIEGILVCGGLIIAAIIGKVIEKREMDRLTTFKYKGEIRNDEE